MTVAFDTASAAPTMVEAGSTAVEIFQLHTPGLGDNTYLLCSGGEMVVIDPQRDLDRIDALLRSAGGRLVAVLETHVHNDYVSGGPALAERHGATYGVPAGAGYTGGPARSPAATIWSSVGCSCRPCTLPATPPTTPATRSSRTVRREPC